MHTETIAAADWWQRPRGEQNTSWIENYKNSLKTRHRDVIVSIVRSLTGVTSVLEVGSHCGPNLIRLARDLPTLTHLTGFDVNEEAVTAGNLWARQMGVESRVRISQGRTPSATAHLADGAVDVVLSCYSLAYIAPVDLDAVLWEMGRLATRAIVIAEPMTDQGLSRSRATLGGYREWAHNYRDATKWIGTVRGSVLSATPVEPPVDALSAILVLEKPCTPCAVATA